MKEKIRKIVMVILPIALMLAIFSSGETTILQYEKADLINAAWGLSRY